MLTIARRDLSREASTHLRNLETKLMIEVDSSLELTEIEAKIQNYLKVVRTALGIISLDQETASTSQEGEVKISIPTAITKLPANPETQLASLRSEALYRRESAKAIFVKNQAAFAISRYRFIHATSKQSK